MPLSYPGAFCAPRSEKPLLWLWRIHPLKGLLEGRNPHPGRLTVPPYMVKGFAVWIKIGDLGTPGWVIS